MTDFDSPWKDALSIYFEAFVALFFERMHREIDWARGYETLDKELQQVTPDAEQGRRVVDKLVQVWRTSGTPEWVLIHVEVQGQEESQFAQRMLIYNCRLVERYNRPVASVAVLADDRRNWRPQSFNRELWDCRLNFSFPIVKLLDCTERSDELEESTNPFAKFVLAHLKAVETARDPESRYTWKVRLLRGLFERGLEAEEVRNLLNLIDWVMELPKELAIQFRQQIYRIQEENHMPYVTSFERLAKEEGLQLGRQEGRIEGLKQGIRAVLMARFGAEGLHLMEEIEPLQEISQIETILEQAGRVATIAELRETLK